MEKTVQPLVSIVVITYNSSAYVLETLESAKEQTYRNLELIVSDDCSTDNTVEICKAWIEKNNDRFVRTELITVGANTGISPNLNRGLYSSKGEWIKFIAGDDMLNKNCIGKFMEEISRNPEIEVLFSNVSVNGIEKPADFLSRFFSFESKEQYLNLLKGNFLPAPGFFIKSTTIKQFNGFDEQYHFLDDYPLFIKLLKSGRKLYHIDDYLVFYRDNNDSVSHSNEMNIRYVKSLKLFYKQVLLPEQKSSKLYFYMQHYGMEYLLLVLAEHKLIKHKKDYFRILNMFSLLSWKSRLEKLMKSLSGKGVHSISLQKKPEIIQM